MRTTDHAATETDKTQTQDINFFVQKALENNPQLKAGKFMENEAMLLQESETIITEDPMLALKYSNVPLSTFPALNRDATSGVGVMLSQTIALPGEAGSRKNRAWNEYISRKENLADMQRMISYRVRTVFQDLNFFLSEKKPPCRKSKFA